MGKINFIGNDSFSINSIKYAHQLKILEQGIPAKRLRKKEAVAGRFDPAQKRDRLHITLPRLRKNRGNGSQPLPPLLCPAKLATALHSTWMLGASRLWGALTTP